MLTIVSFSRYCLPSFQTWKPEKGYLLKVTYLVGGTARKWTQVWLQRPCCAVPGEGTPLAKLWYLRGHLWPFCMSGGPQTNGDCSLQTRILVTLSGKRSHELLQSQKEIKSSWAGSFSHGWSQCRLSIPLSPATPLSSFLHITSLHVYLSCPTLCNPMDCSPSRLLCPWNFTGKNTRVGCHFLLQGIFSTQGQNPCLLHWQADSLPLHHLESCTPQLNRNSYSTFCFCLLCEGEKKAEVNELLIAKVTKGHLPQSAYFSMILQVCSYLPWTSLIYNRVIIISDI